MSTILIFDINRSPVSKALLEKEKYSVTDNAIISASRQTLAYTPFVAAVDGSSIYGSAEVGAS